MNTEEGIAWEYLTPLQKAQIAKLRPDIYQRRTLGVFKAVRVCGRLMLLGKGRG